MQKKKAGTAFDPFDRLPGTMPGTDRVGSNKDSAFALTLCSLLFALCLRDSGFSHLMLNPNVANLHRPEALCARSASGGRTLTRFSSVRVCNVMIDFRTIAVCF